MALTSRGMKVRREGWMNSMEMRTEVVWNVSSGAYSVYR